VTKITPKRKSSLASLKLKILLINKFQNDFLHNSTASSLNHHHAFFSERMTTDPTQVLFMGVRKFGQEADSSQGNLLP
jgi:hypothetical protein